MLIDGGLCVVSVFCDKTFRTEITIKQYPIKAHPLLGRDLEWFYPSEWKEKRITLLTNEEGVSLCQRKHLLEMKKRPLQIEKGVSLIKR